MVALPIINGYIWAPNGDGSFSPQSAVNYYQSSSSSSSNYPFESYGFAPPMQNQEQYGYQDEF